MVIRQPENINTVCEQIVPGIGPGRGLPTIGYCLTMSLMTARKTVAITGSSGSIGSALTRVLVKAGYQTLALVRREPRDSTELRWDPEDGVADPGRLEGVTAVVHLAGEKLLGRWSKRKKQLIYDSRVIGTEKLCRSLAKLERPPEIFISASAIGFYGSRDSETLDEKSASGEGFVAEVCRGWESASDILDQRKTRIVKARLGVVLDPGFGALAKALTPFRLGLGGRLGDGRQYMSWISLPDTLAALLFILKNSSISGPLNLTSPNPVTNGEYTSTLAEVLKRPAFFHIPALALKVLLGEVAEELLLSSQRVLPARLLEAGFKFHDEKLESALRCMVNR